MSRHTAGVEDGELVVQVSDINHLFTAPPTDLMAQNEAAVMREPALLRVVRRLMSVRRMQGVHKLTSGGDRSAIRCGPKGAAHCGWS